MATFRFAFGAPPPASPPPAVASLPPGSGTASFVDAIACSAGSVESVALPPHGPCDLCDAGTLKKVVGGEGAKGPRLDETQDLVPGVYEGGLKVWECSLDLAAYLHCNRDALPAGGTVLEIGCGHGFPGIVAASSGCAVTFQDFNAEVLQSATIPNCQANLPPTAFSACSFVSGDWASVSALLASRPRFDVVLMAETIYCTDYYPALLGALRVLLAPGGVCIAANKRFYFGVGGGTRAFGEAAAAAGLTPTLLRVIEDKASNIREVWAYRQTES